MTPADLTFTRYLAMPLASRRLFRAFLPVAIWPLAAADLVRDFIAGFRYAGIRWGFRYAKTGVRLTMEDYRAVRNKIADHGRSKI